ncbi:hypothetical protein LTS10_004340 [Elasticomyces elasticus]|nr:hypothetical protein LTS10_004340 [Elasticomyces elasticus]
MPLSKPSSRTSASTFSATPSATPICIAIYATADDQRMIPAGMERAVRETDERLSTELDIAVTLE